MEKYTNEVQKIITTCENIAFKFSHRLIGSEHLLLAFLKSNNVLSRELEVYNLNYEKVYKKVKSLYPANDSETLFMEYTLELRNVLENARVISNQYHEAEMSINSLAASLLISDNCLAYALMKKENVDIRKINQNIQSKMARKSEINTISDLHPLSEVKRDPLIGRENELTQLINALSRRNKPNAILIGEPGVGKTAIVEELANLLKNDKIPSLKNKTIYELDLASTVGGTKYRGEFEEKLKKIFQKVIEDGNCILFIDEIHNIIKAGGAEGAIDASNIIKPYLSRGEIQLIGATTEDEFQGIFEKDKALKRRFQIIKVNPSSVEETKVILKKNKHLYEQFYNFKIDDNVLDYIVEQADALLPNAYFPDKAIDILDNTCATYRNGIDQNKVDKTMQIFYKVSRNTQNKADGVIAQLKEKLLGQSKAISKIKKNLLMLDYGLKEKNRPLLSLMFAGPYGVGKLLSSRIIGENYFGTNNVIYLDMSSYQDFTSLSKLIGSNYSPNNQNNNSKLIKELKIHPRSLIILDEFEKAHNEVMDFFLQIINQGYFESEKGEIISCNNCMIILITSYSFNQDVFKYNMEIYDDNTIIRKLSSRFRWELLSSLDDIIVFNYLDKETRLNIAKKYFTENNYAFELANLDKIFTHSEEDYKRFGAKIISKECKEALIKEIFEKQH